MLELPGNISADGKLTVSDQEALNKWRLSNTGRDVVLVLKLARKKHNPGQDGYYWGVVLKQITEAINSNGYDFTTDEVHDFLVSKFNAKQIEVGDGYYLDIPLSSKRLQDAAFWLYVGHVREFAAR